MGRKVPVSPAVSHPFGGGRLSASAAKLPYAATCHMGRSSGTEAAEETASWGGAWVSCGLHVAGSCAQCPRCGAEWCGAEWCGGECAWVEGWVDAKAAARPTPEQVTEDVYINYGAGA